MFEEKTEQQFLRGRHGCDGQTKREQDLLYGGKKTVRYWQRRGWYPPLAFA